jgi:hypothetical protein
MGTRKTFGAIVVAVIGAAVIYYGGGGAESDSAALDHPGVTKDQLHDAEQALGKLRPRDGTSMATYDRAKFGPAWADVDHNGCRTRDDVLARDLTGETIMADHCTVLRGKLTDPYTGHTIRFVRGVHTSMAVQIDHVVPLGWAWSHGASTWSPAQREAYANDPRLLLAVDGPANESKGDSGPATWMPPDKDYRCTYVVRWVTVITRYHLWIDAGDKGAISHTLEACS